MKKIYSAALEKDRQERLKHFDTTIWTRQKTKNALTSLQDLKELIRYKLSTKPTSIYIPTAIKAKFFY